MSGDKTTYTMRAPCPACGHLVGVLQEKNGQDTVRCAKCGRHCYNAPRTETGRAVRSVETIHRSIKPSDRVRILERDGYACVLCRTKEGILHVGHMISVDAGLQYGLSDEEINDDENLIAMCEACNLGYGKRPIPLRVAIAIVRARKAWRERQKRVG